MQFYQLSHHIFWWSIIRHIHIEDCYVFLVHWLLYHNFPFSEVCFVWNYYNYYSFLLFSITMVFLFSIALLLFYLSLYTEIWLVQYTGLIYLFRAGYSETCKENDWKIGDKAIWGEVCVLTSLNRQKCEYICLLWECSQKVDLKGINNQVNSMIHSVDTSHALSLATANTSPWANVPSGHGGNDEGYAWAQQRELLFPMGDLAVATSECHVNIF